MTYQVLARKWRPQTFDAVVGQDAITRTLRNALAGGRVAHAYLFAGPRGVGKTTTARLLARALLCPDRQGPEPCDACTVCQETRAGVSMDLFEIDAASNRKIEDVRALRENVKYSPTRGRYKVYIIDEAHKLTGDAFDALLKTLEEPPAHVVFVLATTEPRDLPPTILSRVQRFDFRPIPADVLRASLERILREEGVPFDPAALPTVVRAAEGSLRDALSLVDTAIAYGNGRLEADTIAGLLGATSPVDVRAFAQALLAYDTTAALEAIDRTAREGEDLQTFARDVIEMLRLAMVLKAAPATQLADLVPAEANELRKLGEPVSLDEMLYVLRAFLDADEAMRESPHPRVELEIAAVRGTRRPVPHALDEVLRRVDDVELRLRQAAPAASSAPAQESLLAPAGSPGKPGAEARRPVAPSAPARPSASPSRTEPSRSGSAPPSRTRVGGPEVPATERSAEPSAAPRAEPSVPPRADSPEASRMESPRAPRTESPAPSRKGSSPASRLGPPAAASVDSRDASSAATGDLATAWQRVIEDVMKKKPTLGAVLMHARPGTVADGELAVVLTGTHFHRETLADRANRELVLQAVRRSIPGAERFTVLAEGGGDVTDHPAVQAALAEFQGEIVAVRPRAPEGDGQ